MSFISSLFGAQNETQVKKPVNTFQATSPVTPGILSAAGAQATGGAGPASDTIAQQSALSGQLQAAANGQGPSPAQALLQKQTQQNINTAAGQAASARGISPALAARMAVDSAGTANQTAAADAATLKAQEQIAARQQLGSNLASTAGVQLGQQQAGTAALGTAGQLDLGAQGLNQRTGAENAQLDLGAQQLQAGIAGQNAQMNANVAGGVLNGIGGALGLAEGGEVPPELPAGPLHAYLAGLHSPEGRAYDGGGQDDWLKDGSGYVGAETPTSLPAAGKTLTQRAGAGLQGLGTGMQKDSMGAFGQLEGTHLSGMGGMYANGGSIHAPVPVAVSPGEAVIPPERAKNPRAAAEYVAEGKGRVPGKAKVAGDSPQNDFIHTKLEAGSVVIPRSITQGKNAPQKAASFVQSVLRRSGGHYRGGPVGKLAPSAESHLDLSGGGMVDPRKLKGGPTSTSRGLGREETRRRIKGAAKPIPEAE